MHSNTSLKITGAAKVYPKVFKVSASLSTNATEDAIRDAFKKATDNRFVIAQGTLRKSKDRAGNPSVQFVAVASPESRTFGETANMKQLSPTQFVDTASQMWKVIGEGSDRRICREDMEDLEEILASRVSPNSSSKVTPVNFQNGDFASAINEKGKVIYGFIFNDKDGRSKMFDGSKAGAIMVDTASVVEAIDPSAHKEFKIDLSQVEGLDYGPLLKMFEDMYRYSPEMVQFFKDALGK